MYRSLIRVWVLTCLQLAPGLRGEMDPIVQLENVAGQLVFYQNQGNSTLVRHTGELASAVQTVAKFEIFDPEHRLVQTKLTYTWDFGNGAVIRGTEPVVRYNYTHSGNYTLRLQVGANVTQQQTPIAGIYSMDVKVLDVIRNIKMEGPSSYQVAENVSLFFHVDGSPPMWVCWKVVPDCRATPPGGCTLTMLYTNTLRVEHTFTSTGVHCMDINARNDVSALHTSYSLYVARDPYSNLFFIMSCLAVLLTTFSFIAVVACRPRTPLTAAATSSVRYLHNDEGTGPKLSFSGLEGGENQPLIPRYGPQYN